jgi:hypothetical protein
MDELYLTIARHVTKPKNLRSIYGPTIFYKEISRPNDFTLSTKEYVFRYDPEWYWAIPDTAPYNLFRRLAPRQVRTSGFYSRYNALRERMAQKLPTGAHGQASLEKLLQDWEVPWRHAEALLTFALTHVDLMGKPWMIGAITALNNASCYPMEQGATYLNLGSYNFAKALAGKPAYENTRLMDDFCFRHQGIKMLYSTTFLDEKSFNKHYNGAAYAKLKATYDPAQLAPTLYEKAVKAR